MYRTICVVRTAVCSSSSALAMTKVYRVRAKEAEDRNNRPTGNAFMLVAGNADVRRHPAVQLGVRNSIYAVLWVRTR